MSDNNIDEQLALVDINELQETDLGEVAQPADNDEQPADNDEHPEDVRDGVYMLVVRSDGENVSATPVLFTMGETGAETLEDAPDDADEFCEMVFEDMSDLLVQLINRVEFSPELTKSDAMIQLLTDMQAQPQELIHNMLASIIVEAAKERENDRAATDSGA